MGCWVTRRWMRKDIKCLQEAHEPYEGSDKDQNDAGCGV